MKLSTKTLEVLKNFATINTGIYIEAGSKLKTKSVFSDIFAEVVVPDTFDKTFAIFNLNELLQVYGLLEEPDLEFTDTHILLSSGKNKIKYFYSNPNVVVYPTPGKDITFPEPEIKFDISSEEYSKILKSSQILKVDSVEFNQSGIKIFNSNSVGNNFTIDKTVEGPDNFSYSIAVSRLKMLTGLDYKVEISSQGISKFYSESFGIDYYIAVEFQ